MTLDTDPATGNPIVSQTGLYGGISFTTYSWSGQNGEWMKFNVEGHSPLTTLPDSSDSSTCSSDPSLTHSNIKTKVNLYREVCSWIGGCTTNPPPTPTCPLPATLCCPKGYHCCGAWKCCQNGGYKGPYGAQGQAVVKKKTLVGAYGPGPFRAWGIKRCIAFHKAWSKFQSSERNGRSNGRKDRSKR